MKKRIPGEQWFLQSFLTFLLSIGAFYVFKATLPEKLFAEVTARGDNIAVDSLMLLAAERSTDESNPASYQVEEGKKDFIPGLISFFQNLFTLERTETGSVRIAYFSDSMTESDFIIQDIRQSYQNKYGGQGIGFVSLSNHLSTIGGRSILHRHSPEWITHSFMQRSPAAFGVSGYVSFVNGASANTRYRGGLFPLVNPTLFYGHSSNGNAIMRVTTEKGALEPVTLQPDGILNKRPIVSEARDMTVRFSNARNIPFYGVDFSGGGGVNIDNFPTRSSTGLSLGVLNVDLMNAFQQELQYDLIVLHFGANVITSKLGWKNLYMDEMVKVVNNVRACFPGASVLVISAADMAKRYGTAMRTNAELPLLLEIQEEYARVTETGFINLFELMGGEGTMVRWSMANPSLVQADFVHFSIPGSRRVANLIFNKLEEMYENFKTENNLFIENEKYGTNDE